MITAIFGVIGMVLGLILDIITLPFRALFALLGGNVATVVRIGDTVRRSTGPWTPAVHELLMHLQDVGVSLFATSAWLR